MGSGLEGAALGQNPSPSKPLCKDLNARGWAAGSLPGSASPSDSSLLQADAVLLLCSQQQSTLSIK